jgi:hypothetical protein
MIKSSCPLKVNTLIRIEKILPKNFCPLLLYSLYPYYLTLSIGSKFEINEKLIKFCPRALYLIIPYLTRKRGGFLIGCSCSAGEASFELSNQD